MKDFNEMKTKTQYHMYYITHLLDLRLGALQLITCIWLCYSDIMGKKNYIASIWKEILLLMIVEN
jgi:hypothetical protein